MAMEGQQGKAVFKDIMNKSAKAFLSSFILENRHELECTTPKFIVADEKREYATIQGVKESQYTDANEQLVFIIADAWYSNQIVIVLTDSRKNDSFHVLKIARPQVLAPVAMNDTTTRFATQSEQIKRDMMQSLEKTKKTKGAGEADPAPTMVTEQVAQAEAPTEAATEAATGASST